LQSAAVVHGRDGPVRGLAVAILTRDEIGGPNKDHLHARARQNVVGELFRFAGKPGRARICALRKGDVEIPSDFAGVEYPEMNDRGAWKAELLGSSPRPDMP
jgi:predicted nucleotide-binding protein